MTRQSLRIYSSLVRQFRNAPHLIQCLRQGAVCDEAVTWSGRRLIHPQGRPGLIEGLIEHWVFRSYLVPDFYSARAGDVVIDIGAHVGLFTVQLARLWPFLRIHAFEPSSDAYQCLERNIESFDCSGVDTYPVALGAEAGTGNMRCGARTLDNVLDLDEGGATQVAPIAHVLDLAGASRIALLKVDIEGSEKAAFENVSPQILKRIDRVVLEYHDNLRPGCLDTVWRALATTHQVSVEPSRVAGCGLLRAVAA